MMINNYIRHITVLLSVIVTLWWLAINFFCSPTCDEVCQMPQWLAFCNHGCVALLVISLIIGFHLCKTDDLQQSLEWSIVVMGVVESIVALCQLYGLESSHNGLYKETGSFYNPGPLGGYLAVCFPVALFECRTSKFLGLRRLALVSMIIMLLVIPSTMSRSGWISTVIGSAYVLFFTENIAQYIKSVSIKRLTAIAIATIVIATVAAFFVWHIKSGSAHGRFFMWKMSCHAVMESPIFGSNSFSEVYSKVQDDYFASGAHSEIERIVAGTPEHAFNEYLHFAILWGIPILTVVIGIIFFFMLRAHKKKKYGICGAVLSLAIFSFASYPMHIPAFVAILVILLIASVVWDMRLRYLIVGILVLLAGLLFSQQDNLKLKNEAMSQWDYPKMLYNMNRNELASKQYAELYDKMKWNGRFLYEYGHILHRLNKYSESNKILSQAMAYTTDPMTLNIMGKNYHAMGDFCEAENCLRRSLLRLPERVYPHYLLFLLYNDSICPNETKAKMEADIIFHHTWKVESSATQEIRDKVTVALENKKNAQSNISTESGR